MTTARPEASRVVTTALPVRSVAAMTVPRAAMTHGTTTVPHVPLATEMTAPREAATVVMTVHLVPSATAMTVPRAAMTHGATTVVTIVRPVPSATGTTVRLVPMAATVRHSRTATATTVPRAPTTAPIPAVRAVSSSGTIVRLVPTAATVRPAPMRSGSPVRPARTSSVTRTTVIDTTPVAVAEDNEFAALGLPAALIERLAREGITTPFPIQTATIPDALAGRDVLGRGQTGSGKTFAFGLPTLARLAAGDRALARRPRALVLTPTRELAMQISDALEPFVHVMGLRHKLVAGGMPYPPQLMALDRGVDLLIATPGRLKDLIERGAVQLTDIAIMILDEADHMAEMGFLPEITSILDGLPEGGQRLLFSATLDRGVDAVVDRYLKDAVTHSTDDVTASVTTMDHHILLIDPQHKKSITAEVANRAGRTLVFVRTKLGADRVAEQLREQGVFAAALHGGLAQGARNRVLSAFKDGSLPVLVATDVAARGIHVENIGVVLQADPPADHKDYLHRSGRTARAGEKGSVITLALPHQKRGMERLAREAGVDVVATRATPGDELLISTGARAPSGVPIPSSQSRRVLEAEKKPFRRSFGGGGHGSRGQGAGPRRSNDGPRGYRGSRD
jgi:superfamily II DNA/RNA helicase